MLDFGWSFQHGRTNRRVFALASIDGGLTGFTDADIIASTNLVSGEWVPVRCKLDLSQCERLQNLPGGTLVEIRIYHCDESPNIYSGEALSSQNGHPGLDLLGTVGAATGGAPAALITAPANNTHYPYGAWPAALHVSALAVDDGAVEDVAFYCGDVLIGSTNEAPFEIDWQWSPAQGAEYLLTAVARDDSGNYGTSDVVRVTAGVDLPPMAAIASPAPNAVVRYGDSAAPLLFSVDAQDDSAVTNVEFFVNGETLGSVTQAPFELPWAAPALGVYRFSAIATDDTAQSTFSPTNFVEILDKHQSALLAFDNFASAPAANVLNGQNPGAGWSAAWVVHNNDVRVPGYAISDAAPLSYHNLQSDPQYATGGSGFNETKRKFDVAPTGPFADYLVGSRIRAPGKTLWVSYLARIDRGGANSRARLVKYADHGGTGILSTESIDSSWHFTQLTGNNLIAQRLDLGIPAMLGETTLFVLRVDFGLDGINHSASCWVNPSPDTLGTASAPPPDATFAIEDSEFWFDTLNWYPANDHGYASFDEFRIGKSWAAVTPPIGPGATLLILR